MFKHVIGKRTPPTKLKVRKSLHVATQRIMQVAALGVVARTLHLPQNSSHYLTEMRPSGCKRYNPESLKR